MRRTITAAGITLIICAAVVTIAGALALPHGVTLEKVRRGVTREVSRWPFFYTDAEDIRSHSLSEGFTVWRLSGAVVSDGKPLWLVHHGLAQVMVDGREIINATDALPRTTVELPISPAGTPQRIEATLTIQSTPGLPFAFGLLEQTPLGMRPVAPHRLFTAMPDPGIVGRENAIFALTRTALLIGLTALTVVVAAVVWVQRRHPLIMPVLAAVVVALATRAVLFSDRTRSDINIVTPETNSDNYLHMARESLGSISSIDGAYGNPGMTIWFMGISMVDSPLPSSAYAATIVFASLGAGATAITAAGLFGDPRRRLAAAWFAGMLAALFPPLLFYQTTLQTAAVETALLAFAFAAAAQPRRSAWLVACGMLLGAAAVVRPTVLLLVPVAAGTLLVEPVSMRRKASLAAVVLASAAFVLVPQALRNRAAGVADLIASHSSANLYIGNNRYASGLYETNDLYQIALARAESLTAATFDDIRRDPLRFATLALHKFGLMVSPIEHSNNGDYTTQAYNLSALIRTLSFGGALTVTPLALIAFVGGMQLVRRSASPYLLLLIVAGAAVLAIATAAFVVNGRHRITWVMLLIPLSAGILAARRDRRLAGGIVAAVAVIGALSLAEHALPRKRFDAAPRAGLTASDIDLGPLSVVGWDVELLDRRGLAVTLAWRLDEPAQNAVAIVSVNDADDPPRQFAGRDITLGHAQFPPAPTSGWQVGDVLEETYYIALPRTQLRDENHLLVVIGLHDSGMLDRLTVVPLDEGPKDNIEGQSE